MPLANTSTSTFLALSNGKMRQKVSPGTPNALPRINKNGVEVFELSFDKLSDVFITDVKSVTTDFGDMLNIKIMEEDGSADYVISVALSSGYSKSFLNVLPNLDLTKPLSLHAYSMDIGNDKTRAGLYVIQEDEKVQGHFWYFDKEAEKSIYKKGFPVYKPKNGKFTKTSWDVHAATVSEYLIDAMEEAKYVFPSASSIKGSTEQSSVDDNTDNDKLPF